MRVSRFFWPAFALAWTLLMARGVGPLPALGPILDFHSGVWRHHEVQWQDTKIPGLKQPVEVAVDSSGVPHIFAQDEDDLYLAQGYLMASQRLFQMDLSSRSTSGRLSEFVGAKGLPMDRYFVRFGMRQAAMKQVNEFMSDERTARMLQSFVSGVNAYIQNLDELPVEYKLLAQHPKPFDVTRVVQMAQALTYSLNGRASGYVLSHLQQQIGTEKVLDLFPEFMPKELSDYILPNRWAGSARVAENKTGFSFTTHLRHFPDIPQPTPGNGSNNWVVGPKKSKTGHSILANDTHLGLSLPNVWFENQLSCPAFNVYGVSLVDVPGIVNGFTPKTAWGPTNGTTAALDYYEVEFTGEDSLDYVSGGKKETATVLRETIAVAGGKPEEIEVVFTKWGPLIHREGKYGLVANWTGFQTGNNLRALRRLYDSTDVKSCLAAFDEWAVPIQNFVCADADHIGIKHSGFIPKREVGEGRFIDRAGEHPDPLGVRIEEKFRPELIDPPEGYLRSANERVVDPTYPYYLGWDYEEPFRGMRIRELLEGQERFSGEDMIRLQNDDFDIPAKMALPILLKHVKRDTLPESQRGELKELDQWDFHDRSLQGEPALFKSWFRQLKTEIFADEYDLPERRGYMPHDIRVIEMLERVSRDPADSDAQWIDDKRTPEIETLDVIVTRAFQKSWSAMAAEQGKDPKRWTWRDFIKTRIAHVAKIPGFGSPLLSMDGSGDSVRGNKGWHGPVYKFVIELGDSPKAWIQVPGGISGDPFSLQFERDVERWARGEMRPVEYYADLNEAKRRGARVFTLAPEEGVH
jgi:penicillin amidase